MYIQAKQLHKQFGNREVVSGIDVEVRPGQVLGLLGPNGAGKSVTIKMLTGQLQPTQGEIVVDGKCYKTLPTTLRGKIGIMPQDTILWDDLTVQENLLFMARLQNMPVDFAKKQIQYLIDALHLQKELKTQAKVLSGGFKRRLNLALSIIHKPSAVFLDEPSPGIDPQNRRFLWDFIQEMRASGEYAIVLTDHYMEEAERLSDYVVIIDEGKVIAKGTVPELKKQYGQGTILTIDFDDHVPPESTVEQLMKRLVEHFKHASKLSHSIVIPVPDIMGGMHKILSIVDDMHVKPHDISVKETSLEDIFLLLAGRSLRE